MVINGAVLVMLTQAFNAAYKKGFQSFGEKELDHVRIATTITSKTSENTYSWLGDFPSLRKWIGDRILRDLKQHNYSVVNDDYELTIGVDRNKIEDDQHGIYMPMFEDMGQSVQVHPSELLFELLLAGASTLCYDGQFFFDTDHPVGQGATATTKSNYDATGGGAMWCLFDTKRPLKPLIYQERKKPVMVSKTDPKSENVFWQKKFVHGVDKRCAAGFGFWQQAYASLNTLNATNFEAARLSMESQVSDEGKKLRITPDVLYCGPSNRSAAETLLKQFLASGADNIHYKAVELVVTPYMV